MTDPVDAVCGVGSARGAIELSARRGVRTLLLPRDRRVVKLATRTADGVAADVDGVRREAAVLAAVPHLARRFAPELRRTGPYTALVENAVDEPPAFGSAAADVAAGRADAVLDTLCATLAELAALHRAGWAHGDLQPRHIVAAPTGIVLLDHGLAQSAGHPVPGYRGGMVHFVAPEVAPEVAAGSGVGTPTADVFALGAAVMFALTGHPPGNYAADDTWSDKLAALAAGRLRLAPLRRSLAGAPALLEVLLTMLAVAPDARPGDAAAALGVAEVSGGFAAPGG